MRKVFWTKSHNKTKIIQKFQNILAGNQTLSLALSLGEGKLAHRKTKGFTLAEVLITLGIIGVVAAMTIPTLIANAQKHSAVTGLIEADSIINQAIRSSMYDTDESGAGELDTSLSIQEFAEKYFKQGTKICIEGRIQTGSYTNKDGAKVYTTEVVVEEQEFAESKSASESNGARPMPANADADGFMSIPDGIENDLPFK